MKLRSVEKFSTHMSGPIQMDTLWTTLYLMEYFIYTAFGFVVIYQEYTSFSMDEAC